MLTYLRRPPNALVVVAAATLILAISIGVRASFGLYLEPIGTALHLPRETFSLAIAIQMLAWGAGQPIFGALADRFGSARIVVLGAVLYVGGLLVMASATGPWGLHAGTGLLVGLGTSAAGFAVVLGPVGRAVAPERRSFVLGIASAGGSFGQFTMALVSGWLIDVEGWSGALVILAVIVAFAALLAFGLRGRPGIIEDEPPQKLSQALREAGGQRGYWLLALGFFVCGFHVTFIATHLPPYLSDAGHGGMLAATAIGAIGFFNIIGTLGCGWLGGRFSKKNVLSLLYLLRAIAIAGFVVLPLSETSVLIFAALLGLLWLGTVPLTSGLVAQMFGTRYMGTLFGIVFFSHQIGAFLGAWLGGVLYDVTNSYDIVWYIAIALGIFAALIHWPIRETPMARLRPAKIRGN